MSVVDPVGEMVPSPNFDDEEFEKGKEKVMLTKI